ncbi:MAG: PIN domain-containing protein [Candidatus Acidiferrum sp.]
MNVLVDTSVWSLSLRRSSRNLSAPEKAIVAELAELINEGRARIIGLVRQELLSGIKEPSQFVKLQEVLRSFPDEPLNTSDYESAASASNECRSKGLAVSVSDMLICSLAKARGWAIFSTDPDFTRFAAVLSVKLHAVRK